MRTVIMNLANFDLSIYQEVKTLCLIAIEAKKEAHSVGINNITSENLLIEAQRINRTRFRHIFSFITNHMNINKIFEASNPLDKKYFSQNGLTEDNISEIVARLATIKDSLILEGFSSFGDSYKSFKEFGSLRNHIEHFGSRLLLKLFTTGNLSTFKWCTSEALNKYANGTSQDDYLRVYNHETEIFYFRKDSYNFKAAEIDLANLVNQIDKLCPF